MNVNDDVWVRLTDHGRWLHRKEWDDILQCHPQIDLPYTAPVEVDGWSCWALWQLMRTFGPACYMGCRYMPFDTELSLVDPAADRAGDKPRPRCQRHDCVNAAQPLHTCPYKREINDDNESLCDCCDSHTQDCADDI